MKLSSDGGVQGSRGGRIDYLHHPPTPRAQRKVTVSETWVLYPVSPHPPLPVTESVASCPGGRCHLDDLCVSQKVILLDTLVRHVCLVRYVPGCKLGLPDRPSTHFGVEVCRQLKERALRPDVSKEFTETPFDVTHDLGKLVDEK